MLAYRKAPRELGKSPAELLMGRVLRSQIPQVAMNTGVSYKVVEERRERLYKAREKYYNRGTKELSRLAKNTVVRLKDKTWDKRGVVLEEVAPRSYCVRTEDGAMYRRNRQELMPVREEMQEVEIEDEETNVVEEVRPQIAKRNVAVDNDHSLMQAALTPHRPSEVIVRRSNRIIKPVDRLDL